MRRLQLIILAMALGASIPAWAEPLRQAILVQNSGWMEPFYEDPASPFKPLVTRLGQAAGGNGEVVVGLFNQADARHPSPEWVYRGPGSHPGLGQALAKAGLAHKQSGALADTDFKEALLGAIETGLESRPGIIWVITNNKNSPNNSDETIARNREFYELLHEEPVITRVAAFPLKMPVQGKHYRANGLMIYALAYGEPASSALQAILQQPSLAALLPEGHVRLKPLSEAAVRFLPTGVKNSPGIQAGLAADRSTLVLSFDAGTLARTAQVEGRFENLFNPYQIHSARTSLVTPPAIGLEGTLSTQTVQALEPGQQSDPLTLALRLPPLPSQWSREVLLRSGYEKRGAIDIRLDDQQLQVSPAFIAHMAELFPGDALPDVFLPPVQLNSSVTRVPLLLKVQYPVWPAVVVYGGGVALLAAALLAALLLGGARACTVVVDGQSQQFRLKPFASANVIDSHGQHVATLKRGLTGARLAWVHADTPIRLK
ncbi:hypothetical protein [Stenotrophomonas sp. S41]|uniref:hypothetical protein n=1 Tax=Stenotrophomonas sp. S41 TaxID=2767464 RepID=UPI001F3A6FD9|nr:hypothetical protein [Stenotrophomonas sp. S41]